MTDAIRDFWGVILAAIGFGVWLVRLEGKVGATVKEIERLEEQMDEDRKDAKDSRRETNDVLKEVRNDIKRLLERGSVQHWNDVTRPPR